MSVSLTEEQARAIAARGKVIVSASAGSGKTFVMIERLVSLILEGADIRRVLAVTFTNKAAAQMRDRLRAAILKKIGESNETERARLKDQLKAISVADISTIHAFCARLIRANFYLADADPAFRVISPDDADGGALSARALDEVFDEAYEEGSEDFQRLLSVYYRKKKDAKLRELVCSVYTAARRSPDYREILSSAGEDGFEDVLHYLSGEYSARAEFFAARAKTLAGYFAENRRAAAVCGDVLAAAESLLSAGGFFGMKELPAPKIAIMPSLTKAQGEELDKLKELSALSAGIKKLYREFGKWSSREEEYARYLDGQRLARALGRLVLRYDEAYQRLKREAGTLDYDDLEHCALKILQNETARAALREKYGYVFVDEYQDVSPAQELLLNLIGGEEVFLVGDAKQSIYGFRGSRSEYFVKKTAEFEESLLLTENFRSAPAVLEAVNRVFSAAMTEKSCGVAYARAPMRGGRRYGAHGGGVFFHRVEEEGGAPRERGVYSVLKESAPEPDAQAEKIASLVEEELGSAWFDADEGIEKRVTFGDIAVLVRKNTADAEKIVAALAEREIPVTTTAAVNVCDFWEARLLIDWLSYLDNPEQDIPYAGALLSRIGGFTESDLAAIRLRFSSPRTFRAACRGYAEKMRDEISAKLHTFAQKTERYRALARVRTAAEMMNLLLSEGLEAEIAAKPDGESRLRRVRRLISEAQGNAGAFLRRLKALGYRVEYAETGGGNSVKVVTMHASKGLEYPVVILAGMDALFHGPDHDEALYTDRFGIAPKSYDAQNKIVYETLLRHASALYEEREQRKGELNVLYVAMTRAKYRLHLLFQETERALSPEFAKRFSDFFNLTDCAVYFGTERPALPPPLPRSALAYRPDGELYRRLKEAYQRPYPFEKSTKLGVKSSATALLKNGDEVELARAAQQDGDGQTAPAPRNAAVDEGLAYHAFLEHLRFGEPAGEELSRMSRENILSEEQLKLLDPEKLAQILSMPSLKSLAGKRVAREQKFLVSLPAKEFFETDDDADEIVFQGALDLLCEDEEGYLILDYKYSSRDADSLKEHYAPQIRLYRKAVAKIIGADERQIRARLLNIQRQYEVEM